MAKNRVMSRRVYALFSIVIIGLMTQHAYSMYRAGVRSVWPSACNTYRQKSLSQCKQSLAQNQHIFYKPKKLHVGSSMPYQSSLASRKHILDVGYPKRETYLQERQCARQSSFIGHDDDSYQKKDSKFAKIGGFIGAASIYLLTQEDRQALAEEATDLDELAKMYDLDIEKYGNRFYTRIRLIKPGERVIAEIVVDQTECWVQHIWVDKSFRQKGIGTALLNAAIKELEPGCSEIGLDVSPYDLKEGQEPNTLKTILEKYYERFGFKKQEQGIGSHYIMKRDTPKQ